jgi:hypothetical protein
MYDCYALGYRISVGKYFHVIDSCHVHSEDLQACLEVVGQLSLKIV